MDYFNERKYMKELEDLKKMLDIKIDSSIFYKEISDLKTYFVSAFVD